MQDLARSGFTVALVAFVFSTMLSAGLGASRDALTHALRSRQVRTTASLVLISNVVVVPLLGVLVVKVFSMPAPEAIGLLLLASSPGAPFAVKLLLMRHGEVTVGAPLQLLLALVGTVTFAVTVNSVLAIVDLGTVVPLQVVPLMATVAVLQLTPFVVGVRMRWRSPTVAQRWLGLTTTTSSVAFVIAILLAAAAAGPKIATLPLSVFVGAAAFAALAAIVGYGLALGGVRTRIATATLAPMRATGPPFAALAVAYGNDPAILGAITGEIVVILGVSIGTFLVASRAWRDKAPAPSIDAASA
jgi:BASS family bile acid:Na+ symporter